MSKSITKKLLAGLTSAAMLATATAVNLTTVPAAAAADTKVIYSTDFEGDSFDFTRRGEDETLELTTEQAHGGSQSLCVSTRAKNWNGPQLALDNLIEANTEYVVNAYAMTPWYATLTLSMQYTDADGNAKERSGHQVSVGYVAKQLKDAGIIKYKGLFELYCSVSHAKTKIDPGTYELSTNYDYRALVKKMQIGSGAMVTTKVTIPEGYTMEQIFHKLEDENVCSYDDLMDAAANYSYNYSFIDQSMQGDAKRLEGFLFPDTYEFYQGMQASSAINKFLENFHDRITAEMLEKADERGMTMQEVVTVASMIEKEAANDDERAMIAAVIYNRIAAGMPLQIDSTIMYVLPEHKDVLTVEDTKIDSPYNTYQNKGLPPTPIANPGLASIKATLSPASTQALYYALDAESGTHKFFTSYGEFQAFVAKQSYSQ